MKRLRIACWPVLGAVMLAGAAWAEAPDVSTAIPRSLRFIEQKTLAWKEKMGCATCHHAPMMLWTSYAAKAQGYEVDENAVATIRDWILRDDDAAGLIAPADPPPDRDGNHLKPIYGLLGLAAGPSGWEGSRLAKETPAHFAALQRGDGSWPAFPSMGKAPIFEGGAVSARMLMLALAELPEDDATAEMLRKGYAWLQANPVEKPSHQLRVLQLLLDLRMGAEQRVIDAQVAALLALQREDGSWAQTAEMPGDAYATGQTLYALGQAGKRRGDAAVDRAIQFLLRTQAADGSWALPTRPMPPAVMDGSTNEPITVIGTAWAVLGLLGVFADDTDENG